MNRSLEEQLRARLFENASKITPKPFNPRLESAASRRRGARIAAAGAGTVAVLAAATLSASTLIGQRDASLSESSAAITSGKTHHGSISKLVSGPLSARRNASSVWTGSELVIWGGYLGNKSEDGLLKDGAAYNPTSKSWRRLDAAPLSPRSGAQATWTGSEAVIWGGSGATSGPQGLVDGAAYDPKSNTWRPIASAPGKGLSGAKTVVVAGKLISVGGGNSEGVSAASDILVFDPSMNTWKSFSATHDVYDAAPLNDGLALLEVDRQGRLYTEHFSLNGKLTTSAQPTSAGIVDRVGMTVHDSMMYILVSDNSGEITELLTGDITAGRMPQTWRKTSLSEPVDAPTKVNNFRARGSLVALPTGAILSISLPDISVIDPHNGKVVAKESSLQRVEVCGADAAQSWTGDRLLSWGGQGCRGNTPTITNQGFSWSP